MARWGSIYRMTPVVGGALLSFFWQLHGAGLGMIPEVEATPSLRSSGHQPRGSTTRDRLVSLRTSGHEPHSTPPGRLPRDECGGALLSCLFRPERTGANTSDDIEERGAAQVDPLALRPARRSRSEQGRANLPRRPWRNLPLDGPGCSTADNITNANANLHSILHLDHVRKSIGQYAYPYVAAALRPNSPVQLYWGAFVRSRHSSNYLDDDGLSRGVFLVISGSRDPQAALRKEGLVLKVGPEGFTAEAGAWTRIFPPHPPPRNGMPMLELVLSTEIVLRTDAPPVFRVQPAGEEKTPIGDENTPLEEVTDLQKQFLVGLARKNCGRSRGAARWLDNYHQLVRSEMPLPRWDLLLEDIQRGCRSQTCRYYSNAVRFATDFAEFSHTGEEGLGLMNASYNTSMPAGNATHLSFRRCESDSLEADRHEHTFIV
ncbi:unnamed protein product [Amoebophrya sp. A120]|nr:unnamed protein product [Amoebophrya sp. A120]|eukprot:GSA120T00019985001.1